MDQPFVQTPNAFPDENLNFTEGEVVYENSARDEMNKFTMLSMHAAGLMGMYYYPYHAVVHSKIPYKEQMEGLPGIPYFEHTFYIFQLHFIRQNKFNRNF